MAKRRTTPPERRDDDLRDTPGGTLPSVSTETSPSKTPLIVVADDDSIVRRLLRSALEDAGYRVTAVANGQQALDEIRRECPDLVLADLMMPVMGGHELGSALKTEPATKNIPFVAMSAARESDESRATAPPLACSARLEKPIKIKELLATIASLAPSVPTAAPSPSTTKARAPFEARFRDDALAGLANEIARLQSLPRTGVGVDSLESVRRLAHRLSGSSGMFGYDSEGELAREIEAGILERQKTRQTVEDRELKALEDNLREIRDRFAAAKKSIQGSVDATGTVRLVESARPERVALLLQDDAELASDVTQAAAARGIRVECFATAPAAFARLKEQPFAILTIGGREVVASNYAWVRAFREAAPRTPLFALARDDSTAERIAAVHSGADQFLDTGLDPARITAAWASVLDRLEATAGRVLCIDDDVDVLRFVEQTLREVGCEVFVLSDASSLFEKLPAIDPAVVLSDLDMPAVDGLDVTRALRASARWSTLPVIAITARVVPEDRARAYAAGVDDLIAKPLVANELVARVTARLDRERTKRDSVERDAVTRLYNREIFFTRMSLAVETALRASRQLALATIELENLTAFVHTHGFEAGDLALNAVASRLNEIYASTVHTMGRLSSGVLAVVQYDTTTQEMVARLEVGLRTLERDARLAPGGYENTSLSLVVGVSSCEPGVPLRELVDRSLKAKPRPRQVTVTEVAASTENSQVPVYIVEDDLVLSEMLQYTLSRHGCKVFLYQTGNEALSALLEAPVQARGPVVLLDVDLPQVNGLTILNTIATERPGYYRVIIMTAHGTKHDQLGRGQSAVVDYMTKPVDIERLVEQVMRLLANDEAPSIHR